MSDILRRAFDRAVLAAERRAWTPGRLGMTNADGTVTISVPDRPNWVYVALGPDGSQGVTVARNDAGVPLRVHLPVKMRREESGVMAIQGVYNMGGLADVGATDTPIATEYGVPPHPHTTDEINLTSVTGDPDYTTLEHYIRVTGSKGAIDGGIITDAGSGTVDVSAGNGMLHETDELDTDTLRMVKWPAASGLTIPTDTARYILVSYNSGSPEVSLSETTADGEDTFVLGYVVNEDDELHIFPLGNRLPGAVRTIQRMLSRGIGIIRSQADNGIVLGETGTRNVSVTAGVFYNGVLEFALDAFDSSGADRFDAYYDDGGGGWTKQDDLAQWPNTLYDNGSGTLQEMTNNRYGVLWFYRELDGDVVMLYGTSNAVSAGAAETEEAPGSVPLRLQRHGVLIGRIVYQKSAGIASAIQSAFTQTFSVEQVTDHGELAGLTDDDHTQYPLLAGRSGGQTIYGGTASGDDLTLESTSHATKGAVDIQPNGGATTVGGTLGVSGNAAFSGSLNIGTATQYMQARRVGVTVSTSAWTNALTSLTGVSLILLQPNNNSTNQSALLLIHYNGSALSIAKVEGSSSIASGEPGETFNIGYQASGSTLQLKAGTSWGASVGVNLGVIRLIW